jgi:glycosyltransferase involved in cell wall biosynthesis
MMRILFLSGRETGYMRNRVLLAALRRDHEVHVLTGGGRGIVARTVSGLLRFLAHRRPYDLCVAGFYGQPLALALSVLQRRPVVLDAFVSTYDTLCADRQIFPPDSPPGRLAYWLDWWSGRRAAHLLTDTAAHARYFAETFGLPREKITPVYVGCDETLFFPREPAAESAGCEVFYYGSFLPLHGTEVILQAAELLRGRPDIAFTIGGAGPRFAAARRWVAARRLERVRLVGWIPLEHLPAHIARARLCLGGHFSTIPKAGRVIPTKTFQFLAMRKPTIVGDSPAIREICVPGEHVYAVPRGDPAALARAIEDLADDAGLRRRLAAAGYELFRQRLTTTAIADQLTALLTMVRCASA